MDLKGCRGGLQGFAGSLWGEWGEWGGGVRTTTNQLTLKELKKARQTFSEVEGKKYIKVGHASYFSWGILIAYMQYSYSKITYEFIPVSMLTSKIYHRLHQINISWIYEGHFSQTVLLGNWKNKILAKLTFNIFRSKIYNLLLNTASKATLSLCSSSTGCIWKK